MIDARLILFDTALEPLYALVDNSDRLLSLGFVDGRSQEALRQSLCSRGLQVMLDPHAAPHVVEQLQAFCRRERQSFDLTLAPSGTAFQQQVWQALRQIPYGTTVSYGELAERVGNPKASRAVGAANGQNPIAIVVPCHRVIGKSGSLTGYACGVERKRALLALEQGEATKSLQRPHSPDTPVPPHSQRHQSAPGSRKY